jgi:putative PIN family toxin of toxin-antitoxin system
LPRVVLDAGVLVAAAIAPRGICGRLLDAALEDRFVIVASPMLLGELARVLMRPKFRRYLTEREARQIVAEITQLVELQPEAPALPGITPDAKDDYLVALARAIEADYLISGDAHLTELIDSQPPVLTPRSFLELLD